MSTEEKEGKARNEEIENQLKKDRMMQRNEIKMLLLGTSQIGWAANKPARGSRGEFSRSIVYRSSHFWGPFPYSTAHALYTMLAGCCRARAFQKAI